MVKLRRKLAILFILLIVIFQNSCTIKSSYLSFQEHIKEVSTAYNWETAKDNSVDNLIIDSMVFNLEHLQSLLIIKGNEIVYEKHKNNLTNETPRNIKSISKSITSILVGIAIDKGYMSLNTNLGDIFGHEIDIDSSTAMITIQQLLTMSGGFPFCGGPPFYRIVHSSFNPVKSTIKKRRANVLSETSEYSNMGSNLLGYAVAKVTNQKLEEFAEKYLFTPLGITHVKWTRDLQGNNISAADIFLCPRDLARIGYLMIQKGSINGQQIVSTKWIEESITERTIIPDFPENLAYGYLWWLDDKNIGNAYCAIGWGGQILYISPDDDMIFVASSKLPNKDRGWPSIIKSIRNIVKLNRKSLEESRASEETGLGKHTYNSASTPYQQ